MKKMEDNYSPYSPDLFPAAPCPVINLRFHFKVDFYEFAIITFVTYELRNMRHIRL